MYRICDTWHSQSRGSDLQRGWWWLFSHAAPEHERYNVARPHTSYRTLRCFSVTVVPLLLPPPPPPSRRWRQRHRLRPRLLLPPSRLVVVAVGIVYGCCCCCCHPPSHWRYGSLAWTRRFDRSSRQGGSIMHANLSMRSHAWPSSAATLQTNRREGPRLIR